ncbi:300_t:CDS:2, partial [Scutellospora calospora]
SSFSPIFAGVDFDLWFAFTICLGVCSVFRRFGEFSWDLRFFSYSEFSWDLRSSALLENLGFFDLLAFWGIFLESSAFCLRRFDLQSFGESWYLRSSAFLVNFLRVFGILVSISPVFQLFTVFQQFTCLNLWFLGLSAFQW